MFAGSRRLVSRPLSGTLVATISTLLVANFRSVTTRIFRISSSSLADVFLSKGEYKKGSRTFVLLPFHFPPVCLVKDV